ncbi:MAG: hypothetical protein J0I06_12935, partial [Planctomycetes bacterium]|nr:hypothetical protein [Planctomycetota bacterium]
GYWIDRLSLVGKPRESSVRSENELLAAAVSPDGKYIATAEGVNGVKLRDAATGRVVEAFWPRDELPAFQVAFTPDGTKLVVLCERTDIPKGDGAKDARATRYARVSVWEVAARKELGHPTQTTRAGPTEALPQYALVGHGRFVLKTQEAYEAVAGTPEQRLKSYRLTITDAVSGTAGASIEVTDADFRPVYPDPLAPDGKTLVLWRATGGKVLRFLDPATGKDRFRAPALRRQVKVIAFSPDGRFVAAATGVSPEDHDIAAPSEVVVWDAATGRELARLSDKESVRNYTGVAFSPDGSFVVARAGPGPGPSLGPSARGASDARVSLTIWGHLPAAEPAPVEPAAKAPAAKGAGGAGLPVRFGALVRDLSGAGVTDARRVEALFLAALGRLPTEVEARALGAQLARRDDKAAALGELLGALAETAEFKAHVGELGRLKK